MVSYEAAKQSLEGGLPAHFPFGQEIRLVGLIPEDPGCPCGGTHVNHVSEIGHIEITKISKKGKFLKVSYQLKNWI